MFCKLKRADGFDTQDVDGYYEAFYKEWQVMGKRLCHQIKDFESVYEVGCGSGVNLYLFQNLMNIEKIWGCDYSSALIHIAKQVLPLADLQCEEAIHIAERPFYDVVMADSVFQYFQDTEYGMNVLEKMWSKAQKAVIITEIHDEEMKEEYLNYRR